jgi:inosine-uridine nucleoside N-ribohydrolase
MILPKSKIQNPKSELCRLLALLLLVCMGAFGEARGANPPPKPVILDTDIGGDIDDAWALSFLLACPELDVKLVVSDSHNTFAKAGIIAGFLGAAGRVDIPIGIGTNQAAGANGQDEWMKKYPGKVHQDGVQALIDTIMNSSQPITLIAIGPVPNLALALEHEPRIAQKARLIVMGGCIGNQEQGEPGFPESNVKNNPKAAQKAYCAGWDVTMTPIDTAGKAILQGEYYAQVRDAQNPVARLIMEQYRAWNLRAGKHARDITKSSSILWDTVAIYLAMDERFCQMRDIRLRVTDQGITQPFADGKLTHVAIAWKDIDSFFKLLSERIANYHPRTPPAATITP